MIAHKNSHNFAFRKTTFTISITFSFTETSAKPYPILYHYCF